MRYLCNVTLFYVGDEILIRNGKKIGKILGGAGLILLETVLLALIVILAVIYTLCKGPSVTARDLFVRSVNESSAMGFTSRIFLPAETVDEIMSSSAEEIYIKEADTSLVTISAAETAADEPDAWGFVDEDGDGIIIDEVHGSTYTGYMMIVKDPSRVILGTYPEDYDRRGYTVQEFVESYGAVAGTNASGFADDNGGGDGSRPHGIVVAGGEIVWDKKGKYTFVGIDENLHLRVDCQSVEDVEAAHMQWGAGYGPVLLSNGEIMVSDNSSGLNPRTAIGQREDGAILLLVIDGRHVVSLGAGYFDEAEVMLRYGAVNACNLDGGSSSLMFYNGEYVNNKAAVVGIRDIPTAWLVMPAKEG